MFKEFTLFPSSDFVYKGQPKQNYTQNKGGNNPVFYHHNVFVVVVSRSRWPDRSPDLTVSDLFLWGALKDKGYSSNPETIDELQTNISAAIAEITQQQLQAEKNRHVPPGGGRPLPTSALGNGLRDTLVTVLAHILTCKLQMYLPKPTNTLRFVLTQRTHFFLH
jgi:hypothetical protein